MKKVIIILIFTAKNNSISHSGRTIRSTKYHDARNLLANRAAVENILSDSTLVGFIVFIYIRR